MSHRIDRRTFLKTFAAALPAAALAGGAGCGDALRAPGAAPAGQARPRPDIVFFLADDLGYGDVACYGAPDIATPVIDRLAAQGVRFTQAYSGGPECSPTRTSFLTGRYLQRVGGLECAIGTGNVGRYDDAVRLAEQHDLGLPPEENTLVPALKAAGYLTAACGKWHLGYERKFMPDCHGFDYSIGPVGGNCDYFHHVESDGRPVLMENGEPVRREGYMTDLLADAAADFLTRAPADRPVFLYVTFTAPHSPYQGPRDASAERVPEDRWNEGTRAKYAEMVTHMDACIGRVLQALKVRPGAGQALVIFASDNGGDPRGRNAPWRGAKGGLYEGGIRVPLVARRPGILPAGVVCGQPAITMDITASILAAAGAKAARPIDGIDVLGHVVRGDPTRARTLFWRARRGERTWRAVRDGDLKYVSLADGEKFEEHVFDLCSDPAETADLAGQRPADLARLKRLLAAWEEEVRPARGQAATATLPYGRGSDTATAQNVEAGA
jgi:N-acetylgalactosamine-6-sulfatase